MRNLATGAALAVLSLSSFASAATPSRRPQSGIRTSRHHVLNFQNAVPLGFGKATLRARRVAMASVENRPKEPGQSIGWDSHKAVDVAPESLVRGVEGNESMRRRFEKACREAQVRRSKPYGDLGILRCSSESSTGGACTATVSP